MFSSICTIQILTICTLFLYSQSNAIFAAWLLAGCYLFAVGSLLLLNDADIMVGFLWLIDLGVGLVFLTFILYLLAYLTQRATSATSLRMYAYGAFFGLLIVCYFFVLARPITPNTTLDNSSMWIFLISWYDYYEIFHLNSSSDLLVLRELYFHANAFEFFLISFIGFYGIIGCVFLTIVIKRSIHYFSKNLYDSLEYGKRAHTSVFSRNQNFLKQRNTTAGSKIWSKTRTSKPQ